ATSATCCGCRSLHCHPSITRPFAPRCAKQAVSTESQVLRMKAVRHVSLAGVIATGLAGAMLLSGCESMSPSFGKKIDYKSTANAPALEIPPDLSSPQFDERYNTASGLAARDATRPAAGAEVAPKTSG